MASVYQRPFMQGQTAVRLIVDHIVNGLPFPPACYLNPLVALRSNLCMFREVSQQKDKDKDTEGALPYLQSSSLQAL